MECFTKVLAAAMYFGLVIALSDAAVTDPHNQIVEAALGLAALIPIVVLSMSARSWWRTRHTNSPSRRDRDEAAASHDGPASGPRGGSSSGSDD